MTTTRETKMNKNQEDNRNKPLGLMTKRELKSRAYYLDSKMRNDKKHEFVKEREGESFTDALTRTRQAMVDWTDYKTLLAQMATAIPFSEDEEQLFRIESLMDETKQVMKGLVDDYPIVAKLAAINDHWNREEAAFNREVHRRKRASMTEQELKESAEYVEFMETIYHKTH